MDVLADAGLLAVADLQDLPFQALAIGFRLDARNGARRLGGDGFDHDLSLPRDFIGHFRGQRQCPNDPGRCGSTG